MRNHWPNEIQNYQNLKLDSPKSQNQFYATLRQYAERLKEERDLSLNYLNQLNQMSEELRHKDMEIQRLNRTNKQLTERLALYNSVITRSRTLSPLRMSTVIGKDKLTESIIETKPEMVVNDRVRIFEQFFIVDLSEKNNRVLKYRYLYEGWAGSMEEVLTSWVDGCEGEEWEVQTLGINESHKKVNEILNVYNSPLTTKKKSEFHKQVLQSINPSYYYFLHCIMQKQLVSMNGKYVWAPVIYGFITFLPFPNHFFTHLHQITNNIKIKSEQDVKVLDESLRIMNSLNLTIPSEHVYTFLGHSVLWTLPDNIDFYILAYSIDVLQNFALQLVIDVLMLLLLEIPITVISEDEVMLAKFMFYFVYVIKPLKYPYPIIFNLSDNMKPLLESPFPTFTGTTKQVLVEPHLSERAVFDLDKKLAKSWPMLDHLDSSRAFLMSIAHRIGHFQGLPAITQHIIKGHQYKDLEPYWKDFSRTQIYNNYVYNE